MVIITRLLLLPPGEKAAFELVEVTIVKNLMSFFVPGSIGPVSLSALIWKKNNLANPGLVGTRWNQEFRC